MSEILHSISASDARIRDLLRQLIRPQDGSFMPIPRAQLGAFMLSHDIGLLGAANSILDMPDYVGRISPALEFKQILAFKMRYCERCITDDPKSEWADGRYAAGWDFGRWFLLTYNQKLFQTSDLMTLRQWLTQFFYKSAPETRTCIARTLLAEILREREVRLLFKDWEKLPELHKALQTALAQKSRFF